MCRVGFAGVRKDDIVLGDALGVPRRTGNQRNANRESYMEVCKCEAERFHSAFHDGRSRPSVHPTVEPCGVPGSAELASTPVLAVNSVAFWAIPLERANGDAIPTRSVLSSRPPAWNRVVRRKRFLSARAPITFNAISFVRGAVGGGAAVFPKPPTLTANFSQLGGRRLGLRGVANFTEKFEVIIVFVRLLLSRAKTARLPPAPVLTPIGQAKVEVASNRHEQLRLVEKGPTLAARATTAIV